MLRTIDCGWGIRSIEDINKLLNCGADKVSINTAAVENSKVVIDSSKEIWIPVYCYCY